MARGELNNPQLIHHYTHVVCALTETRKGSNCSEDTQNAIDNTIKGVCQLVDKMVADEHREHQKTGGVQ